MAPSDGSTSGIATTVALRHPLHVTQRRWLILAEQLRDGHEPCFQTDARHTCGETACLWRAECLALRAAWLR